MGRRRVIILLQFGTKDEAKRVAETLEKGNKRNLNSQRLER